MTSMTNPDDIKVAICRRDFWLKLEQALNQAHGGRPLEMMETMTIKEAADRLAQNGIRMVFDERWHLDAVTIDMASYP